MDDTNSSGDILFWGYYANLNLHLEHFIKDFGFIKSRNEFVVLVCCCHAPHAFPLVSLLHGANEPHLFLV